MPKRVQMHRRKGGWRKEHPDAVIVSRPSVWGNPYLIGHPDPHRAGKVMDAEAATRNFEAHHFTDQGRAEVRSELAGKDLACWCPLDKPCHADVLLKIANSEENE